MQTLAVLRHYRSSPSAIPTQHRRVLESSAKEDNCYAGDVKNYRDVRAAQFQLGHEFAKAKLFRYVVAIDNLGRVLAAGRRNKPVESRPAETGGVGLSG